MPEGIIQWLPLLGNMVLSYQAILFSHSASQMTLLAQIYLQVTAQLFTLLTLPTLDRRGRGGAYSCTHVYLAELLSHSLNHLINLNCPHFVLTLLWLFIERHFLHCFLFFFSSSLIFPSVTLFILQSFTIVFFFKLPLEMEIKFCIHKALIQQMLEKGSTYDFPFHIHLFVIFKNPCIYFRVKLCYRCYVKGKKLQLITWLQNYNFCHILVRFLLR